MLTFACLESVCRPPWLDKGEIASLVVLLQLLEETGWCTAHFVAFMVMFGCVCDVLDSHWSSAGRLMIGIEPRLRFSGCVHVAHYCASFL